MSQLTTRPVVPFEGFRYTEGWLHAAPIKILVAEDYRPFRAFVVSLLNQNPDLHVVGEVSDGLEAVARAQELTPDVVLIDVGLPKLNGLEAARRIREVLPASKIVFLTVENDPDVIEAAFNAGASAYVVKSKAATELLATLNALYRRTNVMEKPAPPDQTNR